MQGCEYGHEIDKKLAVLKSRSESYARSNDSKLGGALELLQTLRDVKIPALDKDVGGLKMMCDIISNNLKELSENTKSIEKQSKTLIWKILIAVIGSSLPFAILNFLK